MFYVESPYHSMLFFKHKENAKKGFKKTLKKILKNQGFTPEDVECESWEEYLEYCWEERDGGPSCELISFGEIKFEDE